MERSVLKKQKGLKFSTLPMKNQDILDDGTDYSEEDQEFIQMIERKNLQRKKKVVENVVLECVEHNPVQALPSDSSESEKDLEESDHGCEVRGAGADKSKKPKKKAAVRLLVNVKIKRRQTTYFLKKLAKLLSPNLLLPKRNQMLNLHKKLTKMVPNHPNQQRLPKHLLK